MKKLAVLLLALLMAFFSSERVYAGYDDIINIQFGGAINDVYDNGAAIDNESGQTWNRLRYSGLRSIADIKYSDNTSSGVTFTSYMPGRSTISVESSSFLEGEIDTPLMRGYLFTNDSVSGSFKFENLNEGTYAIYVYSQSSHNYTSHLSITATTSVDSYDFTTLDHDSSLGVLSEDSNWTKESVVVGADGVIELAIGLESNINGIQLQELHSNPVPEPGSVVLLGIGGVIVLSRLRLQPKVEPVVKA